MTKEAHQGTEPGENTKTHVITIAQPAARCFSLFCAVERTPEWLVELRSARVRKYDAEGRPLVADYMAAPVRGGYLYAMHYLYPPDDLAVSWRSSMKGEARLVEGAVQFIPRDPTHCEMRYETTISLSPDLPGWFRSAQQDRPAQQLCEPFKRWVEGQA